MIWGRGEFRRWLETRFLASLPLGFGALGQWPGTLIAPCRSVSLLVSRYDRQMSAIGLLGILLGVGLASVNDSFLYPLVLPGAAMIALALLLRDGSAASGFGAAPLAPDESLVTIEKMHDLRWELSENRASLRDLLDAQAEIILGRDANGRLTFANRSFYRLFGVGPGEVLGQVFSPEVLDVEMPATGAGRAIQLTQLLSTVEGPRWIAWESHELPPGEDGISELQLVGRDVTEERKTADELYEARNQAESANRAKSRFLAAMSHEIRTPMNGILGMASLLSDTEQSPDQQTYTAAIERSARTLMSLIDEILDFSKIEAGKLVIGNAAFNLADCVQGSVELMAPRAFEKNIELAWTFDPELTIDFVGDEVRIRQVLLNLISNAIKFTDTGGVTVSVTRQTTGSARTAGVSGGGGSAVGLRVEVRDTGIGLPPEDRASLFQEFEQTDASRRRGSGGTGLGLAISKRLARAMNGDLHFEPTPGGGATFILELDLRESEGEPSRPRMFTSGGEIHRGRVLLAFDRAMERGALATLLSYYGVSASACQFKNAFSAVAAAAAAGKPFDRLIVDASRDPASSAAILEAMRRAVKDAKGLVLIDAMSRADFANFRAAGFDAYLIRPVRPEAVMRQLVKPGSGPDQDQGVLVNVLAPDATRPHLQRFKGLQSVPEADGRRPLVLLAEDNEINRLVAVRVLEKSNFNVVTVNDGAAAVEHMKFAREGASNIPDVILMDLFMPGMDGDEAAREILSLFADPAGPRCPPIIALTAHAFAEDRRRCLEAGFNDYLAKPFEPADLVETLRRALSDLRASEAPVPLRAAR